MNASDPSPPEPKSPLLDLPTNSRKLERRAWVILGLTIVYLLLGLCTPNAIFAYRIQRIVDSGGYVRSGAEYFGETAMHRLGWQISDFYQDHYVIREHYDVFLGDTGRAFEPCGAGISLSKASDDDVDRDPGDEGPKMVRALGRIRRLSLAETSVTDQGLAPLAGMTSLESLDLSSTHVKGPGLANLAGMNLKSLSLHSTAIDDEGLAILPHFPQLIKLDIGNTRVSPAGLSRLSSYSKLNDLNLNGLPITDDIVRELSKLSLWRLDLGNTQITDASLPYLEKMSLLADLNLCGTKMSLPKTLDSKHPAIQRWIGIRELVWRPGECEMR
jgi:hypothetical protein